ncbi:MAG: nucleotidyltransferase [Bacteroidetes bacterium]|nr:nucleotidyltransferase [Bacteroidota bacterium]
MILNQDFKEFIKLLEEHEVRYMLVGGYATAYYGYPRFTQDIDFWIWTDSENAKKIKRVLIEFGFSSLSLSESDFETSKNIIQLGYPPNRIDLLTSIDGVDFEMAYPNHELFESEGLRIKFIGLEDLIKNKKATGRLQDLADVEMLEKVNNKTDRK